MGQKSSPYVCSESGRAHRRWPGETYKQPRLALQPMRPFSNPAVLETLENYKPVAALRHANSLMDWDLEVNMPEEGASARGFSSGQLAVMRQAATIKLEPLVEKTEKTHDLNDFEKGTVRVLRRDLDYYKKIPPKLLDEIQKFPGDAMIPWREARKKSDFQIFKPHLSRLIELKQQEANKLGYKNHPYDALLDQIEEGLAVKDLDQIFSTLIPNLKKILAKAESEHVFPHTHPLEKITYQTGEMKPVNEKIFTLLGMPEKRSRMDVSTHPFTSAVSLDDVRVTTRYEGVNFRDTMYSVIHECGHALYELQGDPELEQTPLQGGVSAGFHESQSRFWENIVGRSSPFVSMIYPLLKEHLGFISQYDTKQLFSYFNTFTPSLIRVEADELTYNFHIALRYEIEQKLLNGELSVSDVPSAWNDLMEKHLGIRPKNEAEGVLQDIHWAGAGYAVFPGYTIGNIIAGMIWNLMTKERLLGSLFDDRKLETLRLWLREKIHRWGSTYSPKDLLRRIFGSEYDSNGLVSYLEQKYAP